jgi:5-oxoprolinase (ATP-hydrolysing)
MASSGGLKSADLFQGRDAILSGPAGGVVGMAETARLAGFDKVIGFDMGGTSTDVSHFAGEYERSFETELAGVRLRVPMLRVHTVAAGGGSILFYDGTRFRVGPQSAGADPGPKCYRRGGPLTVTDANVMVGKLRAATFPHIFGPGRNQPLDEGAVRSAFAALAAEIGDGRTPEEVADGFIRIAVENMANAIKKISVQRGYDVTEYALNCFGSAGGQHACQIADTLGMETVLIHPLSGLLSAYGMGLAPIRASREQSVEARLTAEALAELDGLRARLAETTRAEVAAQGVEPAGIAVSAWAHLRYDGTDTALPVPLGEAGPMRAAFEALHLQRFGFVSPEKGVSIAALEVEAVGGGAAVDEPEGPVAPAIQQPIDQSRVFSNGRWHDTPVYDRGKGMYPGGSRIRGPALVIEPHQTVVVEPGWELEVTDRNHLVLRRTTPRQREVLGHTADPVLLEVFNNLYMSIAEQMGEALRNTAQSVNIKERLDFSCAVFDAQGRLVANAPHMPVHLGSMDRSVETVIRANAGRMHPGDVYMLNAPYNGGTHLPDITVITPVFAEGSDPAGLTPGHTPASAHGVRPAGSDPSILFYVASRGHHEDIGGLTPGSMTPRATTIEEEGVYIDNFKLVDQGRFLEAETHALLTGAKYPARSPAKNIADLKAHVAANAKGVAELEKMVAHFGLDVVRAYMGHVQDNAEESVRRLLSRLEDGAFRVEMDQGTWVDVKIAVDRANRRARVDFSDTSREQPNNFNAPEPVTRAATLYVFRVMVNEPIPMNAGCLKPIDIVIPERSMLKPAYPAAVVAGNVETSQIVTNCLFAAMKALGSAQGTMNNLTFGNARYQYYETLCSGSPAGPGFDGTAGVHVHMTNTRLTDPEVLELRYPVLLEEFSIRRGSGGQGRWSAGDGTLRRIRFLERMDCAILSSFRKVRPFGLEGGAPGECGENRVRRNNGTLERLEGCDQTVLEAGEAVIVKTPTGGGFGAA